MRSGPIATIARKREIVAIVPLPKWPARIVACDPPDDGPRRVTAGLDRNLRYAGQVIEAHQVADHENFRVVWQRTIRFDFDPTRTIKLGIRALSE